MPIGLNRRYQEAMQELDRVLAPGTAQAGSVRWLIASPVIGTDDKKRRLAKTLDELAKRATALANDLRTKGLANCKPKGKTVASITFSKNGHARRAKARS